MTEVEERSEGMETVSAFNLVRYTMVKDFYSITEKYGLMVTSENITDFMEAFRLFKGAVASLYFKILPKQNKLKDVNLEFIEDIIFMNGTVPREYAQFTTYRKEILKKSKEVVTVFGEILEKLGYTNVEFINRSQVKSAVLENYLSVVTDIDV